MRSYPFPLPTMLATSGLRRELDRLIDESFVASTSGSNGGSHSAAPAQPTLPVTADVLEDSSGFTLELALPGVAPEAIEVVAEEGVLTVKAERAPRALAEGEQVLVRERPAGRFVRRFRLPKTADLEQVDATTAHGVLTVRVAKVAPAQPRRIEIRSA